MPQLDSNNTNTSFVWTLSTIMYMKLASKTLDDRLCLAITSRYDFVTIIFVLSSERTLPLLVDTPSLPHPRLACANITPDCPSPLPKGLPLQGL